MDGKCKFCVVGLVDDLGALPQGRAWIAELSQWRIHSASELHNAVAKGLCRECVGCGVFRPGTGSPCPVCKQKRRQRLGVRRRRFVVGVRGGGPFRCDRCQDMGEHRGGSCRHFRQCGGTYEHPVVDTGMHSSSDSDSWLSSPWVGRGGVGDEEYESDSSLPGSLPLGQVTPEESQSGSDSSFVGDSLVEAAAMVATTTGSSGGRRYHTRQVAREARGLRPIGAAANEDGGSYYGADEGDSNEEELGVDSSVGGGDWGHLFGSSGESDVNEEGAGSQNQSLVIEDLDFFNLSLSTVAITDSTYLQTQSSIINEGGEKEAV